ncbi:MAG: protein kinase [Bryobacteraceae bacterium]
MSPEQVRGKSAKALFLAAVKLPPEEREAFLKPTADRDPDLAREVRELLSFDEGSDDLLDRPILESLEIEIEPPAPRLEEGELLAGRYRVDGPLGSGASSDVYLGHDELLMGKKVAIKLLRRQTGGSLFVREMEALARINHPGVMQVLDLGETAERHAFLVTEYTPGRTLRSVLSLQALPLGRTVRLVQQVGQALAAAHVQGVAHLDLKPENILVVDLGTGEERVRIIDFGLAAIRDSIARPGTPGGSPPYMAPEQAAGLTSAASDQYSLAAVAVEMCAGTPPGVRHSVHDLFERNCPSAPAATAGVLARALSPNPAGRYASIGEFVDALTVAATPRPRVWRRRIALAAVAAAGVAAIGLTPRFLTNSETHSGDFLPMVRIAGDIGDPSISPDGNTVFYSSPENGGDIYSSRAGQTPVRLTSEDAAEDHPVCSPDGKQLAFLRTESGPMRSIRTMPPSGGPATAVAEGTFQDIAWAPDNRTIVASHFADDGVRVLITAIDTVTRQWRTLTNPPEATRQIRPAVAPDGSAIAFVELGSFGAATLRILDLRPGTAPAGAPRQLLPGRMMSQGTRPVFSRDSSALIFSRAERGSSTLWRVPKEGGDPVEIAAAGRFGVLPMVPAGRDALAFVTTQQVANLWRADLDAPGGTFQTRAAVFPSASRDELPQVGPVAGGPVIYHTVRQAQAGLWWMGLLTSPESAPMQVPAGLERVIHVCLGAGGTRVISGLAGSSVEAYVTRGRSFERLEDVDGPVTWIAPDGRQALFSSERSGRAEIWLWRDRLPSIPVTRGGGEFGLVSPDREWIFYAKDAGALWRVPFGGGEERLLLRGLLELRSFTVAAAGVYYVSIQNPPRIRLRRFDNGRDDEIVGMERRAGRGLAVTADERTILYSQFEPLSTDISVLEGYR